MNLVVEGLQANLLGGGGEVRGGARFGGVRGLGFKVSKGFRVFQDLGVKGILRA